MFRNLKCESDNRNEELSSKSTSRSVDANRRFNKTCSNTKIIEEDGLLSHVYPSSSSSSLSPESVSCSETEQAIAEFASQFSPQQKISFIFATRRSAAQEANSCKNHSLLPQSRGGICASEIKLQETQSNNHQGACDARIVQETSQREHATVSSGTAAQTDRVLLKPGKHISESKPVQISHAYRRRLFLMKVMQQHSKRTVLRDLEANERIQGQFWSEVIPFCVSGYLDLPSIITLRQACTRLYYGRRYAVSSLCLHSWSVVTEQEIVHKVLPQLRSILTPGSFSHLNFSRCCLLTDSFPKALIQFEQRRLCRLVKALILDFCYALSDKSLEVLLSTPLPSLEILSLRCARSRDLTGAPFSTHLSKKRWPRFHQLSCSCTQISLTHLDVVSRFLGERSIELSVAPKLGISGSLASYSLIRRLGLEKEHHNFITAIIEKGTVDAVENYAQEFEKNWLKKIDDPENKKKVLYRFVRNRAGTILLNAPYSIALVEDEIEHEKVKKILESEHNTTTAVLNRFRHITNSCGCCCYWKCLPADPECKQAAGLSASNATGTVDTSLKEQCLNSNAAYLRESGVKSRRTSPIRDTIKNSASTLDMPAACCRLMYPLPIAIRLRKLEIVKFLVHHGAYVDVWGYNFATPLYIACAACPSAFFEKQIAPLNYEDKVPFSKAFPCRSTGNEQHAYFSETFSQYDLPLGKLSSIDSCSGLSAPGNQRFKIGTSPASVMAITHENNSVRNYDIDDEADTALPLKITPTNDATPLSFSSPLCKEIIESNDNPLSANQPCVASRGAKPLNSEHISHDYQQHVVNHNNTINHQESPESVSDNNTQNLDLLSRSSSTSGFMLRNTRALVEGEFNDLALPPTCTFGPLIEERRQQNGAEELDCMTTIKAKNGDRCTCSCHQRAEAVSSCTQTCMEIIEFLLQMGAPVDAPDLYSMKCPINAAIKNNNIDLLEKLIDAGARINVRSLPLHAVSSVIQYSRRHEQKKLAQRGANRLGYKSPLFVACEFSAWKCVEVLLRRGADPHWRDPFSHRNLTPALLAYRKNADMLQLFIRYGTGATKENRWVLSEIIASAILQDDMKAIEYLVREFPDLLELESGGMWSLPLIQASRLDKVAIVQTLLAFGANPNAKNFEDLTSLHLTANEGRKGAVECLLANGALPNIIGGPQKNTPLHVAVEENRLDVVETLLSYGADITIKDATGKTALMTAIAARNDKVAIMLLEHGCAQDLDIADSAGRTALMYAIYFGQFKVADGLVNKGVTCRIFDSTGVSAESLLKAKINSFGKTTSAINKFLRNMVGAAQPAPTQSVRRELDANTVAAVEKIQALTMSNETLRKMNTKRKKMAKCLLKKIRVNLKKNLAKPITEQKVAPTFLLQEKLHNVNQSSISQEEQVEKNTKATSKQLLENSLVPQVSPSADHLSQQQKHQNEIKISSHNLLSESAYKTVEEESFLENSDWRILPLFCDDYYDVSSAVSSASSEISSESEHSKN